MRFKGLFQFHCLVLFWKVFGEKTLIVIYGQYRTFDNTCPLLMKNIVRPNLPNIKIVFILDEIHPIKFSAVAGLCLYPYLKYITVLGKIINDTKSNVPIEFVLMTQALDYLAFKNETFDYAIKVRTDNVVLSPLRSISAVYGHFNGSHDVHMRKFQTDLCILYGRKPTNREFIYAWISTAGTSFFQQLMIFPPQIGPPFYCGPWCFKNSTIWNINSLDNVQSNSKLDQLDLRLYQKCHVKIRYPNRDNLGSLWTF
jgi:hypothetical protein